MFTLKSISILGEHPKTYLVKVIHLINKQISAIW